MSARRTLSGRSQHWRSGYLQDPTYAEVLNHEAIPEYDQDLVAARPSTFVYFLLDREIPGIKVGWSYNPDRRRSEISRLHGRPVELIGKLEGDYDLERCLHSRFFDYRIPGTREWYDTQIMLDVLVMLSAGD